MSGNFDFPPASSSSNSPVDINSIPARFHNIRQTLQRERERDRTVWDTAAADRSREFRDMPPVTRSASRRRPSSSRGAPPPFRSWRRVTHASESTPSTLGRRPRSAAREAYPMPRGVRRALTTREQFASFHGLQDRASDRLEHTNSNLSDLLDPSSFLRPNPFPNLESYLANGTLEDYEEDEPRQRLKRRKLDHVEAGNDGSRAEYGHFGQVVAGQLKMEILDCDGGQLRDDNRQLYRPENVLRNDKSVYCTENARCNLLLRHHNDDVFSLEKLIIKGPDKGFTAPIQEGLIFVSMSPKGLVQSAAHYTIHYAPSTLRCRPRSRNPARSADRERGRDTSLTLLEAINDEETWETYQRQQGLSSSDEEEDVPITPHYQDENDGAWDPHMHQGIAEHCEWATADQILSGQFDPSQRPPSRDNNNDPSPRNFRAPTPPPPPQIRVTTDSDDANFTDVEEESTAADILADRVVREARWRHSGFANDPETGFSRDSVDGDLLPPLERAWPSTSSNSASSTTNNNRWGRRPPPGPGPGPYSFISATRRTHPSLIQAQPSPASSDPQQSGGPASKSVEPQARFFIPEDRCAVAVKFDPPICGKYILLKMFGPAPGSNIDVQSVIAYGFSGQRFFPACQTV